MDYTRQNDHYAVRLADDLLNCCENKMADFLKPMQFPYYTQDILTNRVLSDVGQLKTLLDNASRGTQYINYAPTYMLQDTKKEWFKNNKKDQKDIGCIIYKGKDENGNKHYEMMSPANKFNPGINESPMTQSPVPNVGICRQPPILDTRDPKGIEKYITDVIGNYFNAAFTKTPYFPPQWGSKETEMLSKALNADPSLAIRTSQQAFSQATSVKMENTVNQELNDNVREAMKQGLPPFNTQKQDAIIGPVNINGNNISSNGVDFVNSYYNSVKATNGAEQGNTTVTQNGYIPYQTHNEKPKDIDKFLVEEYGNIMNASLTGTPYSGSVTAAQLKSLSSGIETKMANDPAYMSGIVNQAHQNVLGFNYMPYDKDDFITRAQDPSSREFKMLNETIEKHLNDIIKNKKMSFNGEFQELSRDLTEKRKQTNAANAEKKPSTRTAAGKTTTAKTTAGKTTTSSKTTTGKTTGAKKNETSAAGANATDEVKKPSTRTASGKTTTGKTNAVTAANGRPSAANNEEAPSVSMDTAKKTEKPIINPDTEKTDERPSFTKEVSEFIKKNIIEKKPALVLVDTFLGTVVDKAKKIVRTGKTIAAAFVIATNVLAPNLQMPTIEHLSRIPTPNAISISVNQNDFKSAAQGTVKTGGQARQAQHAQSAKSAARR